MNAYDPDVERAYATLARLKGTTVEEEKGKQWSPLHNPDARSVPAATAAIEMKKASKQPVEKTEREPRIIEVPRKPVETEPKPKPARTYTGGPRRYGPVQRRSLAEKPAPEEPVQRPAPVVVPGKVPKRAPPTSLQTLKGWEKSREKMRRRNETLAIIDAKYGRKRFQEDTIWMERTWTEI